MMAALLVAGIGFVLAGLLAIGFGIPVKEFSFGNTLILAGAVAACTGAILLGLWLAVRELKTIARRIGPGLAAGSTPEATSQHAAGSAAPRNLQRAELAPWPDEAQPREDAPSEPEPAEAAPSVKPRRNLMFSSSSRKERERAQARMADPSGADPGPAFAVPSPDESGEPPPASFDDAWPKSERARGLDAPPQRRGGRAPATFAEADAAGAGMPDRYPPAVRNEDQPPVTVLKSGVVDGMAYSLYSDGSIEAQMPEGMMRFASIDELRSHLEQRP